MDKNYYDILQVNKNASPEIIEKAYKILAKKYHPDLQDDSNKKQAEEILKEINEAYETLSNPDKKKLYDEEIFAQEQEIEKQIKEQIAKENQEQIEIEKQRELERAKQQEVERELEREKSKSKLTHQKINPLYSSIEYEQQLEQARQKAYYDAYIQDLKNRGYKIKYKKSLKDYIKLFFSILILLAIGFILWQIPFIRNFFMDIYNNNPLLKAIIDSIVNLF